MERKPHAIDITDHDLFIRTLESAGHVYTTETSASGTALHVTGATFLFHHETGKLTRIILKNEET